MSRVILVTGATGFVGRHLLQAFQKESTQVVGLARHAPAPGSMWPAHVKFLSCDLQKPQDIKAILESLKPDEIYHLAGQAEVAASWERPNLTFAINVDAQIILLETLRELKMKPRILIVGSSEEYGHVLPEELPVNEENRLRPLSPYAVSKIAQDMLAFQYFRSYGLPIVRTRAFNHTGPGRPEAYAISGWAKQIAAIELGLAPATLKVGNLEAKRDYLDVRDVARAYILAQKKGIPGEVYNVCAGTSLRMGDILDHLLSLTKTRLNVESDPGRLRPSDIPEMCGDPRKFFALTGWKPEIPLFRTLADLLDDWRQKLSASNTPFSNTAASTGAH